jgi:hypothetical protein
MRRYLAVALLLAVAVVLAIGGHDVLSWRSAMSRGDARLRTHPVTAYWKAGTWLPDDPARSVLGLDDELALRRGVHAFVAAEGTPYGFDNGENRTRVRSGAEVVLEDLIAHAGARDASQAGNLLGVLVARGGRVTGGISADDRAREAFETAGRRDPANTAAKYNLELLLRRTRAKASREGQGQGSGALGHGRRGAGAGTPGRGY